MASRYWESDKAKAITSTIIWGLFELVAFSAVVSGDLVGHAAEQLGVSGDFSADQIGEAVAIAGLAGLVLGVAYSLAPASRWNMAYRWKDRG